MSASAKILGDHLFTSVSIHLVAVSIGFSASTAFGVIPFAGGYYEQNFNSVSLGTSGWVDNSTVAGWYARESGSLVYASQEVDNSWGVTSNAVIMFGAPDDPALGAYRQFQDVMFALVLQNTSGSNFESFSLEFAGEQWRRPLQNRSSLVFTYAITNAFVGAGNLPESIVPFSPFSHETAPEDRLTAGGYFREPSFDVSLFEIVGFGNALAGPVDGNSDSYRANYAATVSNTWRASDYLILRWYKNAGDGEMNDAVHLAVDDVRFTATVPEPSTYALLFMACAGSLWLARRRR